MHIKVEKRWNVMLTRAASVLVWMIFFITSTLLWADVPVNPVGTTTQATLPQASVSGTDVSANPGGTTVTGLPQTTAAPATAGLVSLDFQDADIRNVLKVLAFKSGVNIVAAPDVTGVVNIELKDVPWQKALDVILSTYGYGYDRKGNIITVMTVEKLKKYREDSLALENQEPLISKTFYLSFAKAEDVMKIITKLIDKRGFINFDERTNALIIRDQENNLELLSAVIKSIDTITPQVSIETKIVETDLSNSDNLGIDWVNGLTGTVTGATRPTIFPFTQSSGSSSFFPPQTSFGAANAPTPTTGTSTTPGFTYGTISAAQLAATLQFLSTRSTTKILSNPRIVTLDNQKAKINVGEEYPEATYSFNSSTGALQVTGFTQLPIGVNFEVTPHVNNAGLITLDLHPQISAILPGTSGFVTVNGNQLPVTSNQEAETNVMVEDGKTLVIGGLITEQMLVQTTKLPVLGDIPWLGNLLFKNTNTTKNKKEVLIFLTPHIITVGNTAS